MKLTPQQVSFYNENGYLKNENYLTEEEVEILSLELPQTIEKDSPRIILEDNGSIRSIFAPHFVSNIYKRLSKLDRLVLPSEQLIGSKVYLHQFKINRKKGLNGDLWEWHQDFPYWHIDDGIQEADMVSVMIYLQDTDASNGALLLIPKSHKLGIAKFAKKDFLPVTEQSELAYNNKTKAYLSSLNSNLKFTVDPGLIEQFALENGIVTVDGKKGTVLFFHGNIFHASKMNLTSFDRNVVIITYNSIYNLPSKKQNPRPEFLVGRNYEPIDELEITI